ncbi:phosphoenolpyruvate carboxylase [Bartonella sp. DGB2]|uniref:phosphoenolpyruvate carboxylase n=1 Tax=Bartonella sp. DGB2 TaxID=3388426 RepID=UPI00398FBE45
MNKNFSALRNNVNMLGKMLGETIKQALGDAALDRVETIRKLSKSSWIGTDNHREELVKTLQGLADDELLPVARAFSQFLNLANTAEQYHTISPHSEEADPLTIINQTFQKLKNASFSPDEIKQAINTLSLELVLTAHPTEITRRTLIHKMVEMNACLKQLDNPILSKQEHQILFDRLRQLIAQAWHTNEIRQQRPSPLDEAKWGFAVVENSLWEGVPRYLRTLNKQLYDHFQYTLPIDSAPIRFITWMGGDRDGNPSVTAGITRRTLFLSRWKAIDLFLQDIQTLISELSMTNCSDALQALVGETGRTEPYRFILKQLREKLLSTQRWLEAQLMGKALPTPADLIDDNAQIWEPLHACYQSLTSCGMEIIAQGSLLDTLRRVKCFGVFLMRMDIRQESSRHTQALSEITHYLGLGDYDHWSEAEKQAFLLRELDAKRPLLPYRWAPSSATSEVLDCCRMIAQAPEGAIATYIISMTKAPSDVLAVQLLLKEAGLARPLPIVPLFETLNDLNNAESVISQLFAIDWYRKATNAQQMVMIGYSDSAKDAGVMAASWAQYRAQEALISFCEKANIHLTLFHGRGGSIGRGGAPAYAALLSQPPGSLKGGIRVTEQGEMIRFKYGLPEITMRSLALYTCASLEANLLPPPAPKEQWRAIMDELSTLSCAFYRRYVQEDKNFAHYFRAATPEQELSKLALGSRPSKRCSNGGIESLRAIPWIFAWTQNRLMLPAWLGAGHALKKVMAADKQKILETMICEWPFFATRLAMLEMVFFKVDFWLAEYYDKRLVSPTLQPLGQELRAVLKEDIQTVQSLASTNYHITDFPWVSKSIQLRNIYTDPLHLLQVELLHRVRNHQKAGHAPAAYLEQALMVTIAGIAAGMRNTG